MEKWWELKIHRWSSGVAVSFIHMTLSAADLLDLLGLGKQCRPCVLLRKSRMISHWKIRYISRVLASAEGDTSTACLNFCICFS